MLWTKTGFDDSLEDLLGEIYAALYNNSRRLAGMGVRALLEKVMIEKVGDAGTFKETLSRFTQEGYVAARQAHVLEAILEAGHASTHRGWVPSIADLNSLLDVTESVIETVYFHEDKAEALRKSVPPRGDRKKK
jgi:Domain of unknown function (DUF4145)